VTLLLSLACGILFGLTPALQSTRVDLTAGLKTARAGQTGGHRHASVAGLSLSHLLVAAQIALSLLLLVAAGLFVRTLSNLQSVTLGFNRDNVLLFEVNARQAGYQDAQIPQFYAGLRQRLAAIPGVRHATLSHASLIRAGRQLPISVAGVPARDARILGTGPAFLSTMEIPLLSGREIEERDRPDSPPVAVVNELFAKTYFGDENPLGRHITLEGPKPHEIDIIGVSENARYGGLKDKIPPVVYIPYAQVTRPPLQQMTYALRTGADPLAFVKSVRDIVRAADPRVPVTNVRTQTAEIDQTINQEIVFARLCTAFAVLALVIACVGLYGSMAYSVARRTSEIGIRVALGARPDAVLWMVLREVCALAAAGLAIGLPIAFGASRLVASFLFAMTPNDPEALTVAAIALVSAVLLAGYVPARKASRIDPMVALRHE
jgi:macrolide transport system ATP-binding/permease protein